MFAVLAGIASIYKAVFNKTQEVVDITEEQIVTVTELVIYPCKSVQGIKVQEAKVGLEGFELDREWFLLAKEYNTRTMKPGKRYVTISLNRELPKTSCRFDEIEGVKYLVFSHPNQKNDIMVNTQNPPWKEKLIFKNCSGVKQQTYAEDESHSKWFSEAIGEEVILGIS